MGSEEWTILVVDDDEDVAHALADAIRSPRHRCELATNGADALILCRQLKLDVVVTDVRMEGMDGIELMTRLRSIHSEIPVILVTAEGSIPAAVEAVKRGAFSYITKPCEPESLRALVDQAIASRERFRQRTERRALPRGTEELVGSSAKMAELRAQIELVAQATSPVLILGETGTGKELVARAIHACGPRSLRPFVTVNASAIPAPLLESEMFGHMRGAFTGAATTHRGLFVEADGGTLLLDEIGDMPLALQAKLLRVLQSGDIRPVGATRNQHVDVRTIAATHRALPDLVKEGSFRADLYYRLNVVVLSIPPLRERTEDIPELARFFFERSKRHAPGSPAESVSPELIDLLSTGSWPGNVRELESTIERLVVLAREPELRPSHLAMSDGDFEQIATREGSDPCIETLIRNHVEKILQRTDGNKAQAAKLLGVDLSTLYRWQRKWSEGD